MWSQTKVTDYFSAAKKTENNLKINKNNRNINKLSIEESIDSNVSAICVTFSEKKTPKRKPIVNKEKIKTSKRKKTPLKCEISIDFSTNIETNIKANDSTIKSIEPTIESTNDEKKTIQLNANEVKEKLGKCKNLNELKKQLSKINDCAQKVKQFKEMKVKSPIKKMVNNRSPLKQSPIRALMATPIRSPHKSATKWTPNKDLTSGLNYKRRLFDILDETSSPTKESHKPEKESLHAFQRFDHLVNKSDENRSLCLPLKYKILAEAFRCTDYVVSMLFKRQEICTFDKLKKSVEGMTRKSFDIKRLTQILTVFSNSFKLKYELISTNLDNRKPEQQLTISPIYNSNVDIKMNASHLLERYQLFVNKLLDITKGHHNNYLISLGINVDPNQLCRWHKKFQLDDVPDIVPNDNAMPVQPKANTSSAEVLFETSRERSDISSTLTSDETVKKEEDSEETSNQKITKGILKGLSVDLLKKIRAREAAILAQEMTRKPETEKEISILKRLPEFIRIIHSYFVGSKKLAVPYDDLVNKVVDSFHCSLSILEARDHINYLTKQFPNWIYVLEVKKGSYIKINKEANLASLDLKINHKIDLLKNK